MNVVTAARAIPVQDGLFAWPAPQGEARLIVSRCPQCGDVSFPAVPHCRMPACSLVATERSELSGTGEIITWTVQRFAPPGPFGRVDPYRPITIALVEFTEPGIAILGQVWDGEEARLAPGRRARLVLGTLYAGDQGEDVIGWGFTLAGETAR
ncbi:MAG TPA: OB-fold domain-containing protein [Candidatus Dormibacteraeota bacterium]